jgi:tryptophanyl-tRNA synthetase
MKRVLSGIQSSGDPTLGNYLGAIQRWVALQPATAEAAAEQQHFYFIPNLHVLTSRQEPSVLHRDTLSMVAWLIAAGLDQARVTLFVQSQIPAHSELSWILNNFVTMGELGRMTQFKEKSHKGSADGQLVGLFTYPTLMAADILLYDVDEVPVGEDQRQHVELVRDIAGRFNRRYGPTFRLPKAVLPETGARIMNLQDPSKKMSKSDGEHSGNIMLSDEADVIRQKVKRAVTDSGNEVKAGKDKPALTNLLEILSVITSRPVSALEAEYAGASYGSFKDGLAEAIVEHIAPIQQRHNELMGNERELLAILEDGRQRASGIAGEKLAQVKQILGIL